MKTTSPHQQQQSKRAFIYCRVSGHYDPREASLDTQEAGCRKYAKERGITIVGTYHERHTAFHLWERKFLSEIRDRIKSGEGDSILVYELDRLARDQAHTFIIYEELRKRGGKIFCVQEEFEDTPVGKLMMSIKSYLFEAERVMIRERTMRGRQAKLDKGRLTGSHPHKYGYRFIIEIQGNRKIHTGMRQIQEEEAKVVQRIYSMAANGESAVAIAKALNASGIPTRGESLGRNKSATSWDASAIYSIIHDPIYKGEAHKTDRIK